MVEETEQKLSKQERQKRHRLRQSYRTYMLIGGALLVVGLIIFGKTLVTATTDAPAWSKLNANMRRANQPSQPLRGNIYSDEDHPLAISVPYYDTRIDFRAGGFVDSLFTHNVDSLSYHLSRLLKDRSAASYRQHLMQGYSKRSRSWRVATREVTHSELQEMLRMPYLRTRNRNVSGFTTSRYIRRIRPYGSLAQRTIGSLRRDPDSLGITHGNSGLELAFDSVLCGKQGLDAFIFVPPRWIRDPIKLPTNGMSVYTTINVTIQDITERALRSALEEYGGTWACAIVMEVETGQIKALSNLDMAGEGHYIERTNHALADLLEPGSTFKAISMLAALDEGYVTPSDTVDTGSGRYTYRKGLTIVDWKGGGFGRVTVREAMYQSSNIGVAKIVLKGFEKRPEDFYNKLMGMNIFSPIRLEIPGTAVARVADIKDWGPGTLPWVSFGYSVQMPPIYTLRFFNAVANGGKMMEPYLVSRVTGDGGTYYEREPEVINKQIAGRAAIDSLQSILRGVVIQGTGKRINTPNVTVSGKSGTAQCIDAAGRYMNNRHRYSFAAYFPAEKPKYSCMVVINAPYKGNISLSPGAVIRSIAEQVSATQHKIRLGEVQSDSTAVFTHVMGGGLRSGVEQAAHVTGVKRPKGSADWVGYHAEDSLRRLCDLSIRMNTMPNVVGMATSDALYLCETLGLKVSCSGRGGYITHQSLSPGTALKGGGVIRLTLGEPKN